MRRARADRYDDIAQIVDLGMKRSELRSDLFAQLLFVTGNGRYIDKRFKVSDARLLQGAFPARLSMSWHSARQRANETASQIRGCDVAMIDHTVSSRWRCRTPELTDNLHAGVSILPRSIVSSCFDQGARVSSAINSSRRSNARRSILLSTTE